LCEALKKFIAGEFVTKVLLQRPGLPVFLWRLHLFPLVKGHPSYGDLEFSQQSSWDEFLDAYTVKTRRLPRGMELDPKLDQFNASLISQRVRITVEQGPGLPMFSMRQSPLIAAPGNCIRAKDSILQAWLICWSQGTGTAQSVTPTGKQTEVG